MQLQESAHLDVEAYILYYSRSLLDYRKQVWTTVHTVTVPGTVAEILFKGLQLCWKCRNWSYFM